MGSNVSQKCFENKVYLYYMNCQQLSVNPPTITQPCSGKSQDYYKYFKLHVNLMTGHD